MDTISQAVASLNTKVQATASHIATVATAAQAVEQLAATTAAALGTAPTGAQKLQAATALATTLDPTLATIITPLESIFSAVVSVFNLFGLFTHKAAPAPVATPQDGGGPVEPPVSAA